MPTLYDNFSQVRQYIDENNTSYVSKTELANASYVTNSQLSDCSYATTSYVADYVAEHGGGVIDENLIPKENNTYSLGSSSYKYNKVWATNLYGQLSGNISNASQLAIDLGGSTIYRLYADKIVPNTTNNINLGTSNYKWAATYTSNLYADNAYLQDTSYTKSIIPSENNTYTLGDSSHIYSTSYITAMWLSGTNKFSNRSNNQVNLMLNNAWKYVFHANNFSPANDNAINLGESSVRWRSTYTANLYAPSLVLSYSYNSIDNASNTQINFKVNQWNRMKLTNTALMPSTNNGIRLGDSGAQWSSTYVRDLYLNGTNIEDRFTYLVWTGTAAEYSALADYTTYNLYLIQSE